MSCSTRSRHSLAPKLRASSRVGIRPELCPFLRLCTRFSCTMLNDECRLTCAVGGGVSEVNPPFEEGAAGEGVRGIAISVMFVSDKGL